MRAQLVRSLLIPVSFTILLLGGCEYPRVTRMEPIGPSAAASSHDANGGNPPVNRGTNASRPSTHQ
jgi:hypothetical protein